MRTPRPADAREAMRKVANVSELLGARRDALAVDSLEVAVAENARLGERLETLLDEMEGSLVPLLERSVAAPADQADQAHQADQGSRA